MKLLVQAQAKAAASAPAPGEKLRRVMRMMGKTFKEVVGVEMHPGFAVDVDRVKQDSERRSSSGGASGNGNRTRSSPYS